MKLLSTLMRRFVTTGRLTIIDHKGARHEFGPGGEPSATIRITDPTLYRTLFFNPELHAGEAYMDGRLIVE
ncbi:MAG: cyclopropane-fatty-acyl-phospholipid synthase, partial [Pseudomonadota bacterium]